MDHGSFTFNGRWNPISEAEWMTYKIAAPAECYRSQLLDDKGAVTASVVVFRPSNSCDWITVFRSGETLRWYACLPSWEEAKRFAERLLVGFSLFGESALYLKLQ